MPATTIEVFSLFGKSKLWHLQPWKLRGGQAELNRNLVVSRLSDENFRRVPIDFDGSVLSTKLRAESAAVRYGTS